jgi:DNA replication licensing factor MCM7
VSEYITHIYGQRQGVHKEGEEANEITSVRTLSTLIRLSQALARLLFADIVDIADVDEAVRLMKASKKSFGVRADDGTEDGETAMSRIFRLMKGMATRPRRRRMGRSTGDMDMGMVEDDASVMMHVLMADLRESVLAKGFTETQLLDTIQQVGCNYQSELNKIMPYLQYESISVISRSENGQYLWFLDTGKM